MAIGIVNMPNTASPTSDFPSGRIKDDSGIGDGTPINVLTNGDIQEFFAKLLRQRGVTPSGLPDNEYSGNQTWNAFESIFSDQGRSDAKFLLSIKESIGCTVNLTGDEVYSVQRNGRQVSFKYAFRVNVSAVGGGNAYFNVKITPNATYKAMANQATTVCQVNTNGYSEGYSFNVVSDSLGSLVTTFDNGNTASVAIYRFCISGNYFTN